MGHGRREFLKEMGYLSAGTFLAPSLANAAFQNRLNKPGPTQGKSLVNTSESPHAKLSGINMGDVQWTGGFWGERFQVCHETMVPNMWGLLSDPDIAHAFRNFQIAAGMKSGKHEGPPFHDGDFYKWLEGTASVYSVTEDSSLDRLMDDIIAVIAKAQRDDGYIHTPVIIKQKNANKDVSEFEDKLNFETYNMGHLMTAGCVHYRATGKSTLLNVAQKATDYLYQFYKKASPELARNAICPSHYMGVIEMYRTTREKKYLELGKELIDIRGMIDESEGTYQNQDHKPFREQAEAVGHAVRANYLYAGVADVYAESGDQTLLEPLEKIWDDVVHRKIYVTGACGALYDGVTPDGTTYDPSEIQQVHQAYGRPYELPNLTAHNESCANVGNVLWNWRMLQITGDARFADTLELSLYNSVLSGISLDGKRYFYANPLEVNDDLPYELRWDKDRMDYIKLSFCCPPNVVRTIAEAQNYAYSLSPEGVWVNLYGASALSTSLENGEEIKLKQQTDYPWDGKIDLQLQKAPSDQFSVFLRIPGWCQHPKLRVNGKAVNNEVEAGTYVEVKRSWAQGDTIELNLPMPATLLESHPLVEANRNQVAVKRGPIVYSLESVDLPNGQSIEDIFISPESNLQPQLTIIDNSEVTVLKGNAKVKSQQNWENTLYQPINTSESKTVPIQLVPYYAWNNRGKSEMKVWLPLSKA